MCSSSKSTFIILLAVLLCQPMEGFKANDFECIDDTSFKHFTSATDFVVNKCAQGMCFTRNPPAKNPCVGKENALRIDKRDGGLSANGRRNSKNGDMNGK